MWACSTLDKLQVTPFDQIQIRHELNPTKITKCYLVLKGIELLPSIVCVRRVWPAVCLWPALCACVMCVYVQRVCGRLRLWM